MENNAWMSIAGEKLSNCFNPVPDTTRASRLDGSVGAAESTRHRSIFSEPSASDRVTRIVADYVDQLPMWEALEPSMLTIVEGIAREFDRPTHVEHRVKGVASLERKLALRCTEVTQLHEITDLLGLRIVTLNLDSIPSIVSKVEAAFHVDSRKSGLRTNLRGYRTWHVVCAVATAPRSHWFEIQIRTVGEHAWSELQHPIYKGAIVDDATNETLVRIAELYHNAESLAATLRQRLREKNVF